MATRATKTPGLSAEDIRFLDEIGQAAQEAVRKAREENRRLGIPNIQVEGDWIVEELPDGTVRRLRKLEPSTLSAKHGKP